MDNKKLLELGIIAAVKGGEEILKIYKTDFYVETKSDNTPVTNADKASSKIILEVLSGATIPVISEEEVVLDYEQRKNWQFFWLVDPLDGTKEFIKQNGEFSVNIALIEKESPIIGIIYTPILKDLYFAAPGIGSYKLRDADAFIKNNPADWIDKIIAVSRKLPLQKLPKNYTVVASRSYLSREVSDRIRTLRNVYDTVDVINIGSSIKQCWVAEGKAHEYPRFGTTMEWDTAAGQCILEGAGKRLVDLETNLPMQYNKERMENHYFIAGQ